MRALVTVARAAGKAAKMTAAMEVAATAGAAVTATATHDHTGEITMITTAIEEIEVVQPNPHGTGEDATRGAMAPPQCHRTHGHVTAIGL